MLDLVGTEALGRSTVRRAEIRVSLDRESECAERVELTLDLRQIRPQLTKRYVLPAGRTEPVKHSHVEPCGC
jgi:hypothetical protein